MSDQPTHHGYAVNVKDRELYGSEHREALDMLGEDETQTLYENAQAGFWEDATLVAQEHGFRDVYAEGRMGGWAVPQPQPHTDDMHEHELDAWLRDKFRPFEAATLALIPYWRESFLEDVAEAVERKQRTERNNRLALAAWRD